MSRFTWVLFICALPAGCHYNDDCTGDDWDEHGPCGCDDPHGWNGSGGNGDSAGDGGGNVVGQNAHNAGGEGGRHGAGEGGHNSAGEGGHGGAGTGGGSDAPDSGQPASGGADSHMPAPPTPCSKEADCAPGFNCDAAQGKCTPSDYETCGELQSEGACGVRKDCKVVYAGVNCSCGPDCHCIGGEAGCICESFQFFRCEPLDPAAVR